LCITATCRLINKYDDNDAADDDDEKVYMAEDWELVIATFASAVDAGSITICTLTFEASINVDTPTLTTDAFHQTFVRV